MIELSRRFRLDALFTAAIRCRFRLIEPGVLLPPTCYSEIIQGTGFNIVDRVVIEALLQFGLGVDVIPQEKVPSPQVKCEYLPIIHR